MHPALVSVAECALSSLFPENAKPNSRPECCKPARLQASSTWSGGVVLKTKGLWWCKGREGTGDHMKTNLDKRERSTQPVSSRTKQHAFIRCNWARNIDMFLQLSFTSKFCCWQVGHVEVLTTNWPLSAIPYTTWCLHQWRQSIHTKQNASSNAAKPIRSHHALWETTGPSLLNKTCHG